MLGFFSYKKETTSYIQPFKSRLTLTNVQFEHCIKEDGNIGFLCLNKFNTMVAL